MLALFAGIPVAPRIGRQDAGTIKNGSGATTLGGVKPVMTRRRRRIGFLSLVRLVKRFPLYTTVILRLFRDPRVPMLLKGAILGVLAYIVSPLDVVPDFLPVIGRLDDLGMALLLLEWFMTLSPRPVVREHLAAMRTAPTEVAGDLREVQRAMDTEFAEVEDAFDKVKMLRADSLGTMRKSKVDLGEESQSMKIALSNSARIWSLAELEGLQ